MSKNKLLGVIGAIVMTCCLSINVFAISDFKFCDNCGAQLFHHFSSEGISYRDYYNIENIENLEDTTMSVVYNDSNLLVASYNGGDICQDCLENIINEYKASHSETHSTTVSYTGTGVESYTVIVPATLAPGESGDVSVSGTWASNRKLTVTVPNSVTLTNSINPKDTKTLNIDFNGIEQTGDNCSEILTRGTIQVENISNALFGTWTGTITYDISIRDFQ